MHRGAVVTQEDENNYPPRMGWSFSCDGAEVGFKPGKLSLNGTHPLPTQWRTFTPPVEGIF
jgi:hypothetical protein